MFCQVKHLVPSHLWHRAIVVSGWLITAAGTLCNECYERFVFVDVLLKLLSTLASGAHVNVLLTFCQVKHLVLIHVA